MKRQRGRNRNNKNNSGNRQMDSNGPDVKVRGSATQIYDKYTALARDAAVSGNRVKAENYRQHAEHYLRLMNIQEAAKQAAREEAEAARQQRQENSGSDEDESEGRTQERKGRRYPPQVRRAQSETSNGQAKGADQSDEAASANGSAEANSSKEADVTASDESVTEEKPKRRRRAPARKADAEPVVAADAAE